LLFVAVTMVAQAPTAKKQLSHEELVTWKQIQNSQISNDGQWVSYLLKAEEGDAVLKVWNAQTGETHSFDRGEDARFSAGSQFLIFDIKPFEDSLKAQKRRKVEKDEMPRDTLAILQLSDLSLVKIPDVKSFSLPEKWDGWLAYHKEAERKKKEEPAPDSTNVSAIDSTRAAAVPDSLQTEKEKKKKPKKESKKNGTKLVLRELATGVEEVVPFVRKFRLAEEGPRVLIISTGDDEAFLEGVYLFDCGKKELKPMFRQKGEYKQLSFDEKGTQLAFLANLDTADAQIPPFGLLYWAEGQDSARLIADTASAFLPEQWLISENARPVFSKDGSKMFFGMAPPPILQDTNLLDEEIVNVEVWSYTDGRLHTNQKMLLDKEKKRSFDVAWHIPENKFVPLASKDLPEISFGDERNANVALGYTEEPYLQLISWEGSARKDLFLVDVKSGERKEIVKGLRGYPRLSPGANFAWWYSDLDSAWFAYSVKTGVLAQVTTNEAHPFYNELNDVPNYPRSYGTAAWTKDDRHILIYDRYDIWQIDPAGKTAPVNLTNGRENRIVYRYI
ncbi:MAG: hypothetical protein ACE5FF_17965, partial [Saprospiraceae bacterium]